MDTISRENNPSILPMVAAILGGLGVILGGVAMVKLNQVKKLSGEVAAIKNQVDSMAGDATAARDAASRASSSVTNLATQTQRGFDAVTAEIGSIRTDLNKLASARTSAPGPAAAAAAKGKEGDAAPAKAGPGGTYTVKSGDYPAKIARAHGVSVNALLAANPGLEPTKMKVGQVINLPK